MSNRKTVLVTGASSGIGEATVAYFAARGGNVAATMRKPDETGTGNAGGTVRVFRLDVTDPESIEAAVRDAVAAFGRIDVLVNNAGYGLIGPFESMTPEEVRRNIDTNLMGVLNVTRAVLPTMREQRSGRIINVGSVAGQVTLPLYSIYCATKYGVEGFSEALDFELKPLGIRVKIIEPGAIKTDFLGRSLVQPDMSGEGPYDAWSREAYGAFLTHCEDLPGPELVARSIWKAAKGPGWRMRYSPNGLRFVTGRMFLTGPAHAAFTRWMLSIE